MKIRLIYPRFERFLEAYPHLASIPTIGGLWKYRMPPALGTQILAAMMPDDVEWGITDQNVTEVDLDEDVDLVGISFFTPQASAAYALGDAFRKRGVPVIMGGMHPSIVPHDARLHCDSVCLGEVEALWPEILADLRAGRLARTYGPRTPTAEQWVRPRRGLFDDRGNGYDWKPSLVQVARGCPRPCPFCNLPELQGDLLRFRRVEDVVEEIRTLEGRDIYLTEDVIMFRASSIEQYTIELFERLADLDVHVFITSALVFNARPRFLDVLARGHVRANYVTLGFDPLSRGVYEGDAKLIEATRRQVDAMQERGIRFHAAFAVGFDDDDPGIFERILRFCDDAHIITAEFYVATPFPGTPLHRQLSAEGRLHHEDWSRYTGGHVVYRPKQMTEQQLLDGFLGCWTEHYRKQDVQRVLAPFDHVARAPGLARDAI